MEQLSQQPFKRKSRKVNSLFSSAHKKISPPHFFTNPSPQIHLIKKHKSSMTQLSPSRMVELHKKYSFESMKKNNEYGIFTAIHEEQKRQKLSPSKINKWKSLQSLTKTPKKSLENKKNSVNLFWSKQMNSRAEKEKKSKFLTAPFKEKDTNEFTIIHCSHSSRSSTAEISEIAACLEYYEGKNDSYKHLLQRSEKKIDHLLRKASEDKKKSEKIQQLYRQKIKQLKRQKQASAKNVTHLYWYENKNQLIPESVIVEETMEMEQTGQKNNLSLSLESR